MSINNVFVTYVLPLKKSEIMTTATNTRIIYNGTEIAVPLGAQMFKQRDNSAEPDHDIYLLRLIYMNIARRLRDAAEFEHGEPVKEIVFTPKTTSIVTDFQTREIPVQCDFRGQGTGHPEFIFISYRFFVCPDPKCLGMHEDHFFVLPPPAESWPEPATESERSEK